METSSRYKLQNIIRCYKSQWLSKPLPLKHIKAIEAIASCQTEERGVSAYECVHEEKHHSLIAHSCRHRSCSLCSARAFAMVRAAEGPIAGLSPLPLRIHTPAGVPSVVAI